jgi:NAD(P)-dependent dehydrogenase (short-subunit alcohol dehydrogenase family)
MELNLKKKASIQKLVGKIQNKETRLDVIVNNASSIIFGPVETVSPEQFHEQFQVNVFGPILLTQELIPLMRKEKKGHIIFLGSTSGVQSHGMYGAYAASKFALEAIGHSLAVNLHPWNIHVSIIELSATSTLIAKKSLKIGSRLKESDNPYLNYTKYTLDFLQTLLMNGTLPKDIAEAIFKVILNPPDELRYFATKKSKDTFERTLKDPSNIHWKKEVKENSNFYD